MNHMKNTKRRDHLVLNMVVSKYLKKLLRIDSKVKNKNKKLKITIRSSFLR